MPIQTSNKKNRITTFIQKINMLERNERTKLMMRYLVSYLFILLFPILIGLGYERKSFKIIESDTTQYNTQQLQQASTLLDERTRELTSFAIRTAHSSPVQYFLTVTDPYAESSPYLINKTQKNLYNYKAFNQFILDYYLYFNKSEMVLNNDIAYTYKDFYKLKLYWQDIDYNTWMEQMKEVHIPMGYCNYGVSKFNESMSELIEFRYPLLELNKNAGYIGILISSKEILRYFDGVSIDDGCLYIEDLAGTLLASQGDDSIDINLIKQSLENNKQDSNTATVNIRNKKLLLTSLESTASNLRYVIAQPYDTVFKKANAFHKSLLWMLITAIFLGIISSVLLARRNTRSFDKILEHMDSIDSTIYGTSIFDHISSTLSDLSSSSTILHNALIRQASLFKASLLERLLHNDFSTEDEVINQMNYLGISLDNQNYAVVLFVIKLSVTADETSDFNNYSKIKMILYEALNYLFENPLTYHIGEDTMALLIIYPNTEKTSYCIQTLKKLQEYLPCELLNSIYITIGNTVTKLTDTASSYEKAKITPSVCLSKIDELLLTKQISSKNNTYNFPIEIQTKLINTLKLGDKEEVTDILRTLYHTNLMNHSYPVSIQQLFYYDLWSILFKVLNQITLDDTKFQNILRALSSMEHDNELNKIKKINETYLQLCDYIREQKETNCNELITTIKTFILTNFNDPELSLCYLATKFHLNERYLSSLFKKQVGQNLSCYLEEVRLDKAVELIQSTSLSINEIALKVGYGSSNTFCRAFKRVKGFAASSLRD